MDILFVTSLIFGLIGIFLIVFWVMMFLDVLKNKKLDDTQKLLWGIGILFLPFMAILYFFMARSKNALKL